MTIVAHANDDKSLDLLDQCKSQETPETRVAFGSPTDTKLRQYTELWFQHEMGLRRISVLLYVIGWISHARPLEIRRRSCSMASMFTKSYTVGFSMGPSQGTGVSRRSDNINGA
ncbi:hypothetical protein TNCV_3444021 [Trichonephila clavipes]|nr:hypothetical protein TNCV_3444021 [Trichonephila clavipes]